MEDRKKEIIPIAKKNRWTEIKFRRKKEKKRNPSIEQGSRVDLTSQYEQKKWIIKNRYAFKKEIHAMVLIYDGRSVHVANTWTNKRYFPKKKSGFDDSFGVTKSL